MASHRSTFAFDHSTTETPVDDRLMANARIAEVHLVKRQDKPRIVVSRDAPQRTELPFASFRADMPKASIPLTSNNHKCYTSLRFETTFLETVVLRQKANKSYARDSPT